MVVRGEVWWTDFGRPVGSEPGYERPALIVSSDRFNRSHLSTVIVAVVTGSMKLARMPGNVELSAGTAELPDDSVVNVTQIQVIDRARLKDRLGVVPTRVMDQVDDGLRLVLAL